MVEFVARVVVWEHSGAQHNHYFTLTRRVAACRFQPRCYAACLPYLPAGTVKELLSRSGSVLPCMKLHHSHVSISTPSGSQSCSGSSMNSICMSVIAPALAGPPVKHPLSGAWLTGYGGLSVNRPVWPAPMPPTAFTEAAPLQWLVSGGLPAPGHHLLHVHSFQTPSAAT